MSAALPDKARLLEQLTQAVAQRLRASQIAAADAFDGATQDEARSEGKYDTRALEQSYLCAGQNARVVQLRQLLEALRGYTVPPDALDVVAPGALVRTESHGRAATYFVLPLAVGERLEVEGGQVDVVGTAAPVGRALLGCAAGDVVSVVVGGAKRELVVMAVG